jgi:hypothetical protein
MFFSLHTVTTCNPPMGTWGMMQLSLFSSTIGQTSLGSGLYVYIFIDGGEVCGRYADDARLIHASINALTSVVGSHSRLPSSAIILINGQLFSLGSRVLHRDTKPCSFGTTQTFTLPVLVKYPPHAVATLSLTNLGPVVRLDCGEGQTHAHAHPRHGIPCSRQASPWWWHEVIAGMKVVKHPTPHPLTNGRLFSLGSRVLHRDTKPCSFGTTQTFTPPF